MKEYVSLEQKICAVCCKTYETGSILLDKRLRKTLDNHTVTGYGLCEEHQELKDKGYIALIGIDPSKSEISSDGHIKGLEGAYRTGSIIHITKSAASHLLTLEEDQLKDFMFIEQEAIDKIQTMIPELGDSDDSN